MNVQTVIEVSKYGSFLGTRGLGAKVRSDIIKSCADSQQIIIDFSNVDALSHSFADECIGGLLTELGAESFKERIRFKNMSEEIDALLRLVTSRRIQVAKVAQQEQPA
jgi:hypothetical protein